MQKTTSLFLVSLFISVTALAQVSSPAIIKGTIMAPGDAGFAGNEFVVAQNVETGKEIKTKKGDIIYKDDVRATFTLKVPPGKYFVYSKTSYSWDKPAYYTEFVTCGLNYGCPSHKKIIVTAVSGKIISKIDPQDNYYTDPKQLNGPANIAEPAKPIEKDVKPDTLIDLRDSLVSHIKNNEPASPKSIADTQYDNKTNKNDRIFTDAAGIFQVVVPKNWIEEKSNESILLLKDPALLSRRFEIDKFTFQSGTPSVEEFSKDQLGSFKNGKNQNGDMINNSGFIKIGHLHWWFIDYTSKRNTRYKCYQTIYKNVKYNFYYICPAPEFSGAEQLAEKTLSSFKFIN